MNSMEMTAEQWLQQELDFINNTMAHTLNGRMKAELSACRQEQQEIDLLFPLQDWQVNGLGTLHGGMLNAMMDLAMSMAVFCFSRKSIPPTVSMAVNYLRPVPMEEAVLIRTKLSSLGRRNATAFCEAIVPSSGKTAATAIGTYAIVEKN